LARHPGDLFAEPTAMRKMERAFVLKFAPSVESQINTIISQKNIKKKGKKLRITLISKFFKAKFILQIFMIHISVSRCQTEKRWSSSG